MTAETLILTAGGCREIVALVALWAVVVGVLPVSEILGRWFPWFFALPETQQNFLLVAVPLVLTGVLWALGVLGRISRKASAWWHRKQEARRASAQRYKEKQADKLGFTEALAIVQEARTRFPVLAATLAQIMTSGVAKQQEIKRRMDAFLATKPNPANAATKLNSLWVEHAKNYAATAKRLKREAEPFITESRNFRASAERLRDWHDIQNSRNEQWIAAREFYVTFREQMRDARRTFSRTETEKRWEPAVLAMNRKLRAAIREFVDVSEGCCEIFDELEKTCTVIIDVVDEWRSPWHRRVRQRLSGRARRKATSWN